MRRIKKIKMKHNLLLFITILFTISCSTTQKQHKADEEVFYSAMGNEGTLSLNKLETIEANSIKYKDGKCYAKAMIPDVYEDNKKNLKVYIGNTPEKYGATLKTITVMPASTKWEKKHNGDVWCLVEIPAVTKDFWVLPDSSTTKDFKLQEIDIRSLKKSGGVTEMMEILCDKDLTPEILTSLNQNLRTRGYNNFEFDGTLNPKMKSALTKFQQDKGFPQGNLNIKTLRALGVLQ